MCGFKINLLIISVCSKGKMKVICFCLYLISSLSLSLLLSLLVVSLLFSPRSSPLIITSLYYFISSSILYLFFFLLYYFTSSLLFFTLFLSHLSSPHVLPSLIFISSHLTSLPHTLTVIKQH